MSAKKGNIDGKEEESRESHRFKEERVRKEVGKG